MYLCLKERSKRSLAFFNSPPHVIRIHKQLLRTALLIDIGLPVPAFLPHSSIPESVPLEVSSIRVYVYGWAGAFKKEGLSFNCTQRA